MVQVIEVPEIDSVKEDTFSIEDKIDMIAERLTKEDKINFYDLFHRESTKLEVIIAFWAILEMYKHSRITIKQHTFFGDIFIFRKKSFGFSKEGEKQLNPPSSKATAN